MTTAPATNATVKSPAESHKENVEFAAQHNLPFVKIVGNTFPIKGLIYALGGHWNQQERCSEVPQHVAAQAQTAANRFTKGTAEYAAANPPKAPAAPKAKPVQTAKAQPAPKAAPTVHGTSGNFKVRLEMLAQGALALGKDLTLVAPTESAWLQVMGEKLTDLAAKA